MEEMKTRIVANGVKIANEFGYEHCTAENILTDEVYKKFFASHLERHKGYSEIYEPAIDSLLAQIKGE